MSRQLPDLDLGACRVFSHRTRVEALHRKRDGFSDDGQDGPKRFTPHAFLRGRGRGVGYLICGLRAFKLHWASFNFIL